MKRLFKQFVESLIIFAAMSFIAAGSLSAQNNVNENWDDQEGEEYNDAVDDDSDYVNNFMEQENAGNANTMETAGEAAATGEAAAQPINAKPANVYDQFSDETDLPPANPVAPQSAPINPVANPAMSQESYPSFDNSEFINGNLTGGSPPLIETEPIDNGFNQLMNDTGGAIGDALLEGGAPTDTSAEETMPMEADIAPSVQPIVPTNDFAGAASVFGTRRVMASGEAPEEYAVEPGDTLYDVCDQLIDEASYWPKLWSLNPEIKNPHFIYPGMKLKFYPGDEESPPYLQLVTEDDVVPVDKSDIVEKELVREDISNLLLQFSQRQETEIIGPDELTGTEGVESRLMTIGEMPRPDKVLVAVPAFLHPEPLTANGQVVGGVAGKMLIDRDDDIIVKDIGGLAAGSTYTVLRESQDVYRDDGETFVGKRYDFVAHIKLFERLSDNSFLARVSENRLGVQPGDIVVAYRSTARVVAIGQVPPPAGGAGNQIVGFEHPNSHIGGKGSFVIFETKSSNSIGVGQTVSIYQSINRSASSFIGDSLPEVERNVAIVRIIDNTGVGAVGYVLSNRREIRLGDRGGRG